MITIERPTYRPESLQAGVVHFGVGNFHRSHQAMFLDRVLERGARDWAIRGIGLLPGDRAMRDALRRQGYQYTLIERDRDQIVNARRIGSIIDLVYAPENPVQALGALTSPATRIVTLTITEGGYENPTASGPSAFSYIVQALDERRQLGFAPFTVVSCDNLEGNGHLARAAVMADATTRGADLAGWIEENVRFPNSMVDRITPTTTDSDRRLVTELFGIVDERPVIAEPFAQWVIEDSFPAGRPPLEAVGVQVVRDVIPFERMKLRLLNGSHQALAYAGLLAGHTYVHEAIGDPAIRRLVTHYATREALPTIGHVPDTDLDEYVHDVIHRFGNASISDTLVRIATDGAERLSKFVAPVLHDRLDRHQRSPLTAFVLATFALVCATPRLRSQIPDQARERLDSATLAADPVRLFERAFPDWAVDDAAFFRDFVRAVNEISATGVASAAGRAADRAEPNSGSRLMG